MIKACMTEEDFQQLLAASQQTPVYLLKHSTRCPISSAAHRQFKLFCEARPDVPCWIVNVINQRPVSQMVAAETGITHESPQVILFKEGKAVWSASHHSITEEALQKAYAEHAA